MFVEDFVPISNPRCILGGIFVNISRLVATLPDGPLFRDIGFRRCAKFVRMSAIMTGMAVKVNFRMAAAAILDFAESEFLQQNRLWDTIFSPFAKFHTNISHIIPRYSL